MAALGASHIVSCTNASHAHTVATAWDSLEQIGIHGGELAMANCPRCGSTLCKPLPVVRFWLCASTHEVRVEFSAGGQAVFTVALGERPYLDGWDDEELALVAWNALGLGDCEDPRFGGWDADPWGEMDRAWAQKGAA